MSSWLLMGLPGLAYLTGIADAGWTAIGLAVGTYITGWWWPSGCGRYTVVANNSITLPDFFSNRFHDKNRILMCVSALVILVFFRALYGVRVRCLRQAVQQPVRDAVPHRDDPERRRHRRLRPSAASWPRARPI